MAKDDYSSMSGVNKASMLLMSIDEEHSTKLFSMMDDEEIRDISMTMSSLGRVKQDIIEQLYNEFLEQMSASGVVVGNYESTERLLMKALGKERGAGIMEELRGPAGRTTWDKLGNVNEDVLTSYLKNEYPQTIALVVSKIRPDHAARVLSTLPEDLAMEVIMRMLSMEAVKKEIVDSIEKTLKVEFMSNLGKSQAADSFERMAEIFNSFERPVEQMFMQQLEDRDQAAADKVRALMFTFEDLQKIDPSGIQSLMRAIDKDKLPLALKGASETLKKLFFDNMSERAAKILREDMENMGPVRLKDVDDAQQAIIQTAKDLAAKGDIIIADGDSSSQLVY